MEDGEKMSKREQRKMEQVIKLFNQRDVEPKPRKKRRKTENYSKISPNIDTNQQSIRQGTQKPDFTSSDLDSDLRCQKNTKAPTTHQSVHQIDASIPLLTRQQPHTKIILNERIIGQKQTQGLFNYLLEYQYSEMQKKYEKSNINFRAFLRNVRGEQIRTMGGSDNGCVSKLYVKRRQSEGEAVFSKVHQQFKQELMKLMQK